MLDRHEAPIASERLPERLGGATGGIDPGRKRPTVPPRNADPSSATSPAACAQICEAVTDGSLRSPSMCASVINRQRFAVPHRVLCEQHDVGVCRGLARGGVAGAASLRLPCPVHTPLREAAPAFIAPTPERERGTEQRFHPFARAGLHEPRGAVEAVSIGQCDERHAELGGAARELFGRERALLQREAGANVEVHERRIRRAGIAQRGLQGESNRCSSLGGAVARVQTWREMRYLPDVEPLPVGFAPGAGPFGGGANWSAVLGPAG